ncbi:hypothetical protein K2173_000893 [Erythroxylum novogranatense]|uniref:Uncharacterized protein n=1 Tax=Erythroxylum novogranatense TaxID=1862640 RepID=A0AAV8TSE7_9ROSI|nr:hypothetical protein K2173_000893 [Erythroxylum novogranatense]
MTKDTAQLSAAKVSYKNVWLEGNRQEEAWWANVIEDILKNRGEYMEALRWLQIDYEYIDVHNNIGMLELDLDNLEEVKTMLTKGLEICDEEEIGEDDDCRSRLHHNLGSVYMELRVWKEAWEHIEKDIIIC